MITKYLEYFKIGWKELDKIDLVLYLTMVVLALVFPLFIIVYFMGWFIYETILRVKDEQERR